MDGRLFSKKESGNTRCVFWPNGLGPVWDEVDFLYPASSWGFEMVDDFIPPTHPDKDGCYTWLEYA